MRYECTPQAHLRVQAMRSVCSSVWQVPTQLHQQDDARALLADMQTQRTTKPGEVDTLHSTEMRPACNNLQAHVAMALESECGFVGEPEHLSVGAMPLVCRGARPHHDCGNPAWLRSMFWALALQDSDTDLFFGNLGLRLPITAGALYVFDPGQPHAVISQESAGFRVSDFKKARRQYFLVGEVRLSPAEWRARGVQLDEDALDMTALNVPAHLVHQHRCVIR